MRYLHTKNEDVAQALAAGDFSGWPRHSPTHVAASPAPTVGTAGHAAAATTPAQQGEACDNNTTPDPQKNQEEKK